MKPNCPKIKWCDWVETANNDLVIKEVCKACGRREMYPKRKGKIDQNRYLQEHARDFAQPGSRTWADCYGNLDPFKQERQAVLNKQRKERDLETLREEARKWLKRDGTQLITKKHAG